MSDIAIRAVDLSKQYRFGQHRSYPDLRESFMKIVYSSFGVSRSDKKIRGASSTERTVGDRGYVLANVSFEIQAGEIVAILGRNGSGKTTLLRILSQITYPTTGYVQLLGRVGTLLDEGAGFHPELTGRENIYLRGSLLGMKRDEYRRKLEEIIAFAELEQVIDTPLKFYSSGMCVRLAFSVAVHLEADILLVDEVLAAADREFQAKCLERMLAAAREGRTVLLVSHDLDYVRAVAGRGLVFDRGRIVYTGPASDSVDYYVSSSSSQGLIEHSDTVNTW
jgi:lipopolysaccharide transport system ATP-binding protein